MTVPDSTPVLVPGPKYDSVPAPSRFRYPPEGKVYFVLSVDPAKRQVILEWIDRPQPGDDRLPALAEASQVLVEETDDEGRPCLMRCTWTEETETRGRFLTAKYVVNGRIAR